MYGYFGVISYDLFCKLKPKMSDIRHFKTKIFFTRNKYDKNGKREAISFINPFLYLQTNKDNFLQSLTLLFFKMKKDSCLKYNYIY